MSNINLYRCWECEEYFLEEQIVESDDPFDFICVPCWEGMSANRLADPYDDPLLLVDTSSLEEDDI